MLPCWQSGIRAVKQFYTSQDPFFVASAVNDTLVSSSARHRLSSGRRPCAFAIIQSFIMAMQYSRFANEKKKLYDKLHETDLTFMQAQIKPHFIYNALSAISHMCGTDPKRAKNCCWTSRTISAAASISAILPVLRPSQRKWML